jgi:hypothetical protein
MGAIVRGELFGGDLDLLALDPAECKQGERRAQKTQDREIMAKPVMTAKKAVTNPLALLPGISIAS